MLGLCIIPRGLPCVGGLWGLCSPHFAPKSVRGVGESRTPACCTHGPREVLPAKRKSDQRTHRAPPLEYRSHPPRIPSSCRAPQSSCCTKVSFFLFAFCGSWALIPRHPRRAHEPSTSPCGSDPEPTSHLARTDATVPTAARATHPCAAHAAILRHARSDAAPRPHIENAALCCPCTTPHTLVFAAFRRPAPTQLRVSPPTPLCSAEQQLATKLSRSVPILNPSPRLTSSVPHYPPLAYLSPAQHSLGGPCTQMPTLKNAVESAVNLAERAIGVDIDKDGDIGVILTLALLLTLSLTRTLTLACLHD